MIENQAAVRSLSRSIKSPFSQKNSKKTSSFHKKQRKGFSVAEAMIALLIGSLALGMAAPMITKQVKSQTFADSQYRVIMDRLEKLEQNSGQIPKGTVAFFSSNVVAQSATNPCPAGWSIAPASWKGRFFKMADEVTPRGTEQEQSIQEHWHSLPTFDLSSLTGAQWQSVDGNNAWVFRDAFDAIGLGHKVQGSGTEDLNPPQAFAGSVFRTEHAFVGSSQDAYPNNEGFEQQAPNVSNDDETRPKNVALLVCIKD